MLLQMLSDLLGTKVDLQAKKFISRIVFALSR